jgi:hypothetical protein
MQRKGYKIWEDGSDRESIQMQRRATKSGKMDRQVRSMIAMRQRDVAGALIR